MHESVARSNALIWAGDSKEESLSVYRPSACGIAEHEDASECFQKIRGVCGRRREHRQNCISCSVRRRKDAAIDPSDRREQMAKSITSRTQPSKDSMLWPGKLPICPLRFAGEKADRAYRDGIYRSCSTFSQSNRQSLQRRPRADVDTVIERVIGHIEEKG